MSKDFNNLPKSVLDMLNNVPKVKHTTMSSFIAAEKFNDITAVSKAYANATMAFTNSMLLSSEFTRNVNTPSVVSSTINYAQAFATAEALKKSYQISETLSFPWKEFFPMINVDSEFFTAVKTVTDYSNILESKVHSITTRLNTVKTVELNELTIKDGIVGVLYRDWGKSDFIDKSAEVEGLLEETNNLIENLDDKDIKSSLDKLFITLTTIKVSDSTKSIIRDIIISVIATMIVNFIQPQSAISNNNTTVNNITINNYNIASSSKLLISEIIVGKDYIAIQDKVLKSRPDKKAKALYMITQGTIVTVIKKSRKWLYVSLVTSDGIYILGNIDVDDLVELKK